MSGWGNNLQLKITLEDVEPDVWRRVLVPASLTLGQLHFVIQEVMPWRQCHMHRFYLSESDEEKDLDMTTKNDFERWTSLTDAFTNTKQVVYEYDFGDSWMHVVELEEEGVGRPAGRGPVRCVDGQRACPPEDCGGPGGYMDMLEDLADRRHPDHAERVRWLRDMTGKARFNPEAFNVAAADRLLKRYFT